MRNLILLFFLSTILVSCGGSDDGGGGADDTTMQSGANDLISFRIVGSQNNLPIDADVKQSGNNLQVFFPANANLTQIIPVFEISPDAKMFLGDTEVTSGVTFLNFSSVFSLRVVAENDDVNIYTVTSESNFTQLDNQISDLISSYNAPGFQVAIIKNEKLVYANSYGNADLMGTTPVTNTSLFRIASISKPITAVAILKLVEDGVLSLDDTVFGPNGILGTTYGTYPYEANKELITVKHLLDHTAGWNNFPFDVMFSNITQSQDDLISEMLDSRSLVTEPGTTYFYLNFGYSVLGRVIEQVSGQSYEAYVQQSVLAPAGIIEMKIANNGIEEKWPNEVEYFEQEGFSPYTDMNVNRMDAHGGWVASATDLAKFITIVDRNNNVTDLVNSSLLSSMYFGFQEWFFTGSLPGTSAVIGRLNNEFSYIILTNTRTVPDVSLILNDMKGAIVNHIQDRNVWPGYDLF